jgi:hypothetical protein
LQPPGSRPEPEPRPATAYRRLWLGLGATLALGVAVVVALPKLVSGPEPAARQAPAAAPVAPPAAPDDARRAAEQALRDFLRLRARLELAGAPRWGEPQWSEAARQAESGDRLFAGQRFDAALQRYAGAVDSLERLEADRTERLAAALAAGRRALEADQGAAAQAQFERALLIEPNHAEARRLLGRAQVRAQVSDRLQRGREAEDAGELEAARQAYRAAVGLDAQHQTAARALERVELQLEAQAFRQAMGNALAALDAGRLDEARKALERAQSLKPADNAVRDARDRLEQATRRGRLEGLRSAATARVTREDWSAAVGLYQEALAVEPGAAFARQGLARARERLRLHEQLDYYLDQPARLYSPEPLAAAGRLLAAAGPAPADQPRLAEKLTRLQQRVQEAGTPVPVTLRSDGETDVVIHHVSRLGRFQVRQLELRPGTYTAVGSRPGYRDVRRVFTVEPGQSPPAVLLRCEEPV